MGIETNKAVKIRVIKKASAAAAVSQCEAAREEMEPPKPKDVFRNVSDWVRQNQARKRDEERVAAEAFFGAGAVRQGI